MDGEQAKKCCGETGVPGLRERKKLRLRQRILQNTLRMLTERGYDETRLSDIAAAVEIGEATFYRYFGSKEDLFTEVTASLMQIPLELADLTGDGSVEDQLRMLCGVAKQASEHRWLLEKCSGTPVAANLLGGRDPASVRATSRFARALEDAQAQGRIASQIDEEILADLFVAMLNSAVLVWARRCESLELQPRLDAVIEVFLHGILAPGTTVSSE